MQALEGGGRPPYSLTHPHPRPHVQSLTGQSGTVNPHPPKSRIKRREVQKSAIFNIIIPIFDLRRTANLKFLSVLSKIVARGL